jgi:hypothetical protein
VGTGEVIIGHDAYVPSAESPRKGRRSGRPCYHRGMAREPPPPPDLNVIFRRSAAALAEAFRGLAREREATDPEAVKDLLAAASAIERPLAHIG